MATAPEDGAVCTETCRGINTVTIYAELTCILCLIIKICFSFAMAITLAVVSTLTFFNECGCSSPRMEWPGLNTYRKQLKFKNDCICGRTKRPRLLVNLVRFFSVR